MFGLKKKQSIDSLEIRFYTDAAAHGSHGKIKVSNRRLGLDNKVVNFVFVGMTNPPAFTPSLVEYIWNEARAQGYMPLEFIGMLEVNRPVAQAADLPLEAIRAPGGFAIPERLLGGATIVPNVASDPTIGHQSAGFEDAERQAAVLATANS